MAHIISITDDNSNVSIEFSLTFNPKLILSKPFHLKVKLSNATNDITEVTTSLGVKKAMGIFKHFSRDVTDYNSFIKRLTG